MAFVSRGGGDAIVRVLTGSSKQDLLVLMHALF